MNIIIKRGVEKGVSFCKFYTNDNDECQIENLASITYGLTGVTYCDLNGILTGGQRGAAHQITRCQFKYGYVEKIFEFPLIDFEHDDVLTIEKLVKERIKLVKDWIKSVDWCEELEFNI
jgi:hypothetical protein